MVKQVLGQFLRQIVVGPCAKHVEVLWGRRPRLFFIAWLLRLFKYFLPLQILLLVPRAAVQNILTKFGGSRWLILLVNHVGNPAQEFFGGVFLPSLESDQLCLQKVLQKVVFINHFDILGHPALKIVPNHVEHGDFPIARAAKPVIHLNFMLAGRWLSSNLLDLGLIPWQRLDASQTGRIRLLLRFAVK